MKKTLRALFYAFLFLMPVQLMAQITVVQDFTGTTVGNSVTATVPGWSTNGTGTATMNIANTTPLTYTGYNAGGGNYVAGITSPSGTKNFGQLFTGLTGTSNTYYYAYLLNVSNVPTGSNYFQILAPTGITSTSYFSRIFAQPATGGYNLGVAKSSATGIYKASPTVLAYGTTYLILVRYSYNNVTGTDDQMYLWINPAITSEPTTASAEISDITGNDGSSIASAVGVFDFRLNTATPTFTIDGIRLGGAATSADAFTAMLATAPTATTSAVVTKTTTTATLPGSVTDNGAATTVSFDWGTDAGLVGATNVAATPGTVAAGAGATSVSYNLSGLTAGTQYYYRVNGANTVGTTNGTILSFTTTSAVTATAPTVTTSGVTIKGSTTATLPGSVTDNGANTTVSFDYNAGAAISGTPTNVAATPATITAGTGLTNVAAAITGLTANTQYAYRVNGVNSAGTTNGSVLTFTTPPAAPVLSALTAVNSGGFTVNWSAVTAATGYFLDVSTDNTFTTGFAYNTFPVSGTSQVVTGLSASTPYFYRVRATNANGTGDNSTTGTQTTSAPAVPTLTPTPSSLDFGTTQVTGTTAVQTFSLSAASLTASVTLTTAAPYSISKDGTTYSTTLTYTTAELASAATVSVKFAPTATGTNPGSVSIASTGATTKTVTLAGTAVAPTPTLTANPTSLDFGTTQATGTTSAAQTFSLSAANLTAGATLTTAAPYSISKDGNTYSTTVTYTTTDLASAQTVSVKFAPTTGGANPGSISIASTGATTQTVTLTGTAVAPTPTLAATPASLDFGTTVVEGTPSTAQTFSLSATGLTASATVTTTAPYSISSDGVTYGTSLTLTTATLATPQTISVKFTPIATTAAAGTITIASTGATSQTVNLTGTGVAPSPVDITSVTSPYVENFDGIATGLPRGFGVYTTSTTTALGAFGSYINSPATATWAATGAGFKNYASGDALTSAATTTDQSSSTNRALGIRQTGTATTGGDPGADFVFQVANTSGKQGFKLNFNLQSLDATSGRITTWAVSYGFGASPATFTTITPTSGTLTTGNTLFSNNAVVVDFGNALDNSSQMVTIRIAALAATTGSGNRASSAIDDFSLSWTNIVAATPTLAATPTSINFGTTQIVNTTSAAQTFSLSASNLTAGATLTTAAPYSISSDGTTFGTTATFTAAQLASAQTVSVKFTPTTTTAAAGSVSITSTGATTQTVTLTGTGAPVPATPTLVATPTALDFGTTQIVNTTSTSKTFALSGLNLTANASLVVTGPYKISTDNTTFSTSASFTSAQLSATPSPTVYVQFLPTTTTAAPGAVSISSTGATTQTVALTGTGANPPTIFAVGSTITALTTTAGTASSTTNFSVSASNLTANLVITAPAGFELATSQSGVFSNSITITPTSGSVATMLVYLRLAAADVVGTYSGNIVLTSTNATTVNVPTVNSTVTAPAPVLNATGTLAALTTTTGTASSTTSFVASGSNLTADITIAPPAGFELSTSQTTGFGSTVTLPQVSGAVANTTVYVRLATADAVGSYNGNITLRSSGTTATIATATSTVSAASVATPTITATGTLIALTTTAGRASSTTNFSVSGSNLTAGIVITPPTGFEVSTSASTGFASTITLPQTSGSVASTTVYARLAAADAAGTYSGNIVLSSTGVTPSVNVATVSSTVSAAGGGTTGGSVANHVVIAQIYGGNGNTYDYDWIELYNPTSANVDMSGWSVQYNSATGTAAFSGNTTFPAGTTIKSHGYFLIQEQGTAGSGSATNFPTPDIATTGTTNNFNMSSVSGKVALVNNSTTLAAPPTLPSASIVDFIGYGAAVYWEGAAAAPALTVSTALERKASTTSTAATMAAGGSEATAGNGYDSDNNSTDFLVPTTIIPLSSASPLQPSGGSTTPTPAVTSTGTLTALTTTAGTASTTTNFTVAGTNLTAGIVVTPPTGFEVSTSATTGFASTITVPQTSGTVASTTVYARLAAADAAGTYSGNIVLSSTGATSVNVATASSTVTAASTGTPTITATPGTLSFNNVTVNATSATQTFSLSASSPAATTTLTTVAPFQISKDGTTYSGSISYTAAELAAAKTVSVQFAPTASGTATGTISISGSTTTVSLVGTTPAVVSTGGAANHVVIAQIYGGNGNTYDYDWIELYNPTSANVDMSGWSVQYNSATGTAAFSGNTTFPAGTTIKSHGYFLIQEQGTAGSGSATNFPTPDIATTGTTNNFNMSSVSGKVALVNNSTTLAAPPTLPSASIVDFIGYGAAVYWEGAAAAPALTVSTALERKASATSTAATMAAGGSEATAGNGYDSDNNSTDFLVPTTIIPLSSASPLQTPPSGTPSTTPTLAVTPSSVDFGTTQTVNTASAAKPIGLTGTNLTASVTLTTAAPFSISSDGITYGTTLTYTTTQMANAQAISVRFTPTTTTAATGSITIASTGATSQTVSLTGTGAAATGGTGGTATETISMSAIAQTYGNPDFAPATSNNTAVPIIYSSDNATVATIVAGKVHIVGAGSANITASQAGDGTYAAATNVTVPLIVSRQILTATADNQTKVFGAVNPALTVTYTGFVNGDGPSVVTTQPTVTTTATTTSAPGNYPITASGAASANYNFLYKAGTMSITAPATYANLTNITLSTGNLSPAFNSTTLNYTNFVDYSHTSATITVTAGDPQATIVINGAVTGTGSVTGALNLVVGNNSLSIVVTSRDGSTKATYLVNVMRGSQTVAADQSIATNVISPNGDGQNDAWVVKDIASYPNNKVTVFDGAGRTVYSKVNYGNDWAGTLNGSPLAEGTYYYAIDLGQNIPIIKGFITIVRTRK